MYCQASRNLPQGLLNQQWKHPLKPSLRPSYWSGMETDSCFLFFSSATPLSLQGLNSVSPCISLSSLLLPWLSASSWQKKRECMVWDEDKTLFRFKQHSKVTVKGSAVSVWWTRNLYHRIKLNLSKHNWLCYNILLVLHDLAEEGPLLPKGVKTVACWNIPKIVSHRLIFNLCDKIFLIKTDSKHYAWTLKRVDSEIDICIIFLYFLIIFYYTYI